MENEALDLKADLFRALGHSTRLQILELLKDGECCVCEIVPALDMEQSTVSRHLAILRQNGLVTSRKEGQRVFYRLANEDISKLLGDASAILKKELRTSRRLIENL